MLGGDAPSLPDGVRADQLGGVSLADLRATLDAYLRDGYIVLMHGSPPCDQVSAMNTTGPSRPNYPAKLAKSLRIVHAFVALAERYAVAWTLENPATGRLWKPEWLRGHLAPADRELADVPRISWTRTVDYCQYGWPMKKETGLAFSSPEMRDAFPARRCPGNATCDMCVDAGHGRRAHAVCMTHLRGDYDCSTKHARYPIPPALVVHMIGGLRAEAKRALSPQGTAHPAPPTTPPQEEEEEEPDDVASGSPETGDDDDGGEAAMSEDDVW